MDRLAMIAASACAGSTATGAGVAFALGQPGYGWMGVGLCLAAVGLLGALLEMEAAS